MTANDDLMAQVLEKVLEEPRRVAILGAGQMAARLLVTLAAMGLESSIVGVFDEHAHTGNASIVRPLSELTATEFDVLVVAADAEKEKLLSEYMRVDGRPAEVIISGSGHFEYNDDVLDAASSASLPPSLASGYPYCLVHLVQCLRFAAHHGLSGDVAEFGVYKGGTTAILARVSRALGLDAKVLAFDAFGASIPRASVLDLYQGPSLTRPESEGVVRYLAHFDNVEIVRGNIVETCQRIAGRPLVLSFFDTDNYSPTRAALPLCVEQTVIGGSIVFDHYFSSARFLYTLGERVAANEVLSGAGFFHLHGTGVFTRVMGRAVG